MPNLNKVIWKPVLWPCNYEVSDTGLVRNAKTRRVLKTDSVNGYLRVRLGKGRREFVHRLVLESFVGLCPEGFEACHNNGIRGDNSLSNLRWDSRSNNQLDRKKHGTDCSGRTHPGYKITPATRAFIKRAYRPRSRSRGAIPIAKRLGIHHQTVQLIANGNYQSCQT